MDPRALARKALTVSGWTLASRIRGLVRDRLWAGVAGGSVLLDAYLTAFTLPNLLRNLFGEGALSAAFSPRYAQLVQEDPVRAEQFAAQVVTRLTLWLSVLATIGIAGCSAVMALAEPMSKAWLVATLALPMVPFLVFICVSAVMSGMLNVRRHFWVAAASPVILNLAMISTIWLSPDEEVWWAPYAVLAAGILMTALHLGALRRTPGGVPAVSLRTDIEWRNLKRALAPNLMASGVYQINVFIDSQIAFFLLGPGAVQFLYFGNRLLQFPMALIGHGVTTVAFPEMSRLASQGWPATAVFLRDAARLQAFWLLPAAVGLVVCAEPLVRTIYQTGNFGQEAVARTVLVTQFLGLSLVPISLSKLLVRAFHAHQDQRTPLHVSLVMVGVNLLLNLTLVFTPLQEAGLALATALSGTGGFVTYLVLLHRRGATGLMPWRGLVRPVLAALAMGVVVQALWWWWPQAEGRASGYAALRLMVGVAVGGAVYLGITGTGWLRRKKGQTASP